MPDPFYMNWLWPSNTTVSRFFVLSMDPEALLRRFVVDVLVYHETLLNRFVVDVLGQHNLAN